MQAIHDIQSFNFDTVPIDEYWNVGDQKEHNIHRIHSYPAKFPAFLTSKALQHAETYEAVKPRRIADMFCGCGTTAYEASKNNMDFWGCDINPVATLIAKVKSSNYQITRLDKYFNTIINERVTYKISDLYSTAPERLKYWFPESQYNDLLQLKYSILSNTPQTSKYRLFFLCAFSNILKSCSMWLTKSIKPQLDPNKKPRIVMDAFIDQFSLMKSAFTDSNHNTNTSIKINTGSFLDNNWDIPNIDIIITSPPYVTSYEYADLHQLSTLWLGYVDDYRNLREGTIGSLHHEYNFNKELKRLNNTGLKIVTLLLDQYKVKARSVAKYFLDMQIVASESYNILNNNGIAYFVIGNTEYKGVRIDNAKHLTESLSTAGFKSIQVTKRKISRKILTPYRDERGKFTSRSSGKKVYSEEFIVLGRKG